MFCNDDTHGFQKQVTKHETRDFPRDFIPFVIIYLVFWLASVCDKCYKNIYFKSSKK